MCDKLNELIAEERNEGEKRGILIGAAQGILHTQKETAKSPMPILPFGKMGISN